MSTLNGNEYDNLLTGTADDDNISGNGGDDTILAGDGDDALRGGDGDDLIDGGAGTDQIRYDRVFEAVQVDLGLGTASDGRGDTDTLISIEDIRGSIFADTLIGSDSANHILADAEDDVIIGGGGADMLYGEAGDDTLEGGAGDDRLIGGDGIDVARFDGDLGSYILQLGEDALIVSAKRTGTTGDDRLEQIEILDFEEDSAYGTDGTLDVTLFTGVTQVSAEDLTSLAEFYIGYFGRAPDALGLAYWATRLADGMDLGQIAASFYEQDEAQALYGGATSNTALVEAAYANLFERAPDAAGLDYWVSALDAGTVSRPEFMLDLINGAKAETGSSEDARVLADKVQIGTYYAIESGLTDLGNAAVSLDVYDPSNADASLLQVEELIDMYRDAATAEGSTELVVDVLGLSVDDTPI